MRATNSISLLIGLISCTLFLSCADSQNGSTTASTPITASKAMELAKREAAKQGEKVQDYELRVVNTTNTEEWLIFFQMRPLDSAFANALGKDFIITVDKKTGHTVLMPGE